MALPVEQPIRAFLPSAYHRPTEVASEETPARPWLRLIAKTFVAALVSAAAIAWIWVIAAYFGPAMLG